MANSSRPNMIRLLALTLLALVSRRLRQGAGEPAGSQGAGEHSSC